MYVIPTSKLRVCEQDILGVFRSDGASWKLVLLLLRPHFESSWLLHYQPVLLCVSLDLGGISAS